LHLALSYEHLKTLAETKSMPKYLIFLLLLYSNDRSDYTSNVFEI